MCKDHGKDSLPAKCKAGKMVQTAFGTMLCSEYEPRKGYDLVGSCHVKKKENKSSNKEGKTSDVSKKTKVVIAVSGGVALLVIGFLVYRRLKK